VIEKTVARYDFSINDVCLLINSSIALASCIKVLAMAAKTNVVNFLIMAAAFVITTSGFTPP